MATLTLLYLAEIILRNVYVSELLQVNAYASGSLSSLLVPGESLNAKVSLLFLGGKSDY